MAALLQNFFLIYDMTVILEIKPKFSDWKIKLCLHPVTEDKSSQKISSSLTYCDPVHFDD